MCDHLFSITLTRDYAQGLVLLRSHRSHWITAAQSATLSGGYGPSSEFSSACALMHPHLLEHKTVSVEVIERTFIYNFTVAQNIDIVEVNEKVKPVKR